GRRARAYNCLPPRRCRRLETGAQWFRLPALTYVFETTVPFASPWNPMTFRIRTGLVPVLCVLALAAGCSKKDDAKKPATQVAAKVNSDEITVHQVNAALARLPNV